MTIEGARFRIVLSTVLPTIAGIIDHLFTCLIFQEPGKKVNWHVPHLKDRDHEVTNNNRPISLLLLLSKVAESHTLGQFNNYVTQKNRLT